MQDDLSSRIKNAAPHARQAAFDFPRIQARSRLIAKRRRLAWVSMAMATFIVAAPIALSFSEEIVDTSLFSSLRELEGSSLQGNQQRNTNIALLNVDDENSSVVELNPDTGSVVRSIKAGFDPDVEFSPDGSVAYITSRFGDEEQYTLNVFDQSGTLIDEEAVPDRWARTGPGSSPIMATNESGNLVFIYQMSIETGTLFYSVATYDSVKGALLPEVAQVPGCEAATLFGLSGRRVAVLCQSNDLHVIAVSETGASESTEVIDLPESGSSTDPSGNDLQLWRPAGGFLTLDRETLFVVSHSGAVFTISMGSSPKLIAEADLDLAQGSYVAYKNVALSPTGAELMVGLTTTNSFDRVNAQEVVIYDTRTWTKRDSFVPPVPLWSIQYSAGGDAIYGSSLQDGRLFTFNRSDQQLESAVSKVPHPSLIDALWTGGGED